MWEMQSNSLRTHYAGKIALACVLIKIGTTGAISAMMGNFVAPIVRELGCQVSELTMMISLNAVAMALMYTTASKLLIRKKIGMVMGIASLVEVIGLAMMAFYRNVYLFYCSGALIGAAQSFTGFVSIPIVVNMWFKKKTGTVLGAIIAIGSAATIIYGLLSAQLITWYGWRTSYLILAAMALIITVPAVFLIIKSPQEAGCRPYGEDEASESAQSPLLSHNDWSLTRKQAFRLPLVYVAWLCCIFYSYGSGVSGYIVPFTTMELSQSINFGARTGMFLSLGGIACSLILGKINDKFGPKAGLLWGSGMTMLGYGLMFFSYQTPACAYLASFVVGLGMSMYTVQCPLLARHIVGTRHYSEIWAIMMVANSLIGGGLYSTIGLFYDKLGSYRGAFIMAIGLFAAALLVGSLAIDQSKRIKQRSPNPEVDLV